MAVGAVSNSTGTPPVARPATPAPADPPTPTKKPDSGDLDFTPSGQNQQMGGGWMVLDLIPGYEAKFWAPYEHTDFSMPVLSVLGAGEKWIHGKVGKDANTIPYRAGEVTLQSAATLGATFYFHRASLYADLAAYKLDPKLSTQPGPDSQPYLPLDASRLARVSGNGDADEAAAYAGTMTAGHATMPAAVGELGNRLVQAVHTHGLSLLTTALSADTYFAAAAMGRYITSRDGTFDARPPELKLGPLTLSYPSIDYYRTANGPYVQARVFVNPRSATVPLLTVGTTLDRPGVRVGAALWRVKVIDRHLYVSPQVAVDLQHGGTGYTAGIGADVIVGKIHLTTGVSLSHDDIIQNDVRNRGNGVDTTFGLSF